MKQHYDAPHNQSLRFEYEKAGEDQYNVEYEEQMFSVEFEENTEASISATDVKRLGGGLCAEQGNTRRLGRFSIQAHDEFENEIGQPFVSLLLFDTDIDKAIQQLADSWL
jgi:hypothetical protein